MQLLFIRPYCCILLIIPFIVFVFVRQGFVPHGHDSQENRSTNDMVITAESLGLWTRPLLEGVAVRELLVTNDFVPVDYRFFVSTGIM